MSHIVVVPVPFNTRWQVQRSVGLLTCSVLHLWYCVHWQLTIVVDHIRPRVVLHVSSTMVAAPLEGRVPKSQTGTWLAEWWRELWAQLLVHASIRPLTCEREAREAAGLLGCSVAWLCAKHGSVA